jgi:hypothetical protein
MDCSACQELKGTTISIMALSWQFVPMPVIMDLW